MLREFVENKHTVFADRFDSWEDAIKAACVPFLIDGTIEEAYIDSVIKCVKDFGPYIVIAPNIAMPHASTGSVGVHKNHIAFMKVENPVHFDPNDPSYDARLFFTLAAVNSEKHLENMMKLSEMLMNDDLVADLLNVKSDEDLLNLADKYQ